MNGYPSEEGRIVHLSRWIDALVLAGDFVEAMRLKWIRANILLGVL